MLPHSTSTIKVASLAGISHGGAVFCGNDRRGAGQRRNLNATGVERRLRCCASLKLSLTLVFGNNSTRPSLPRLTYGTAACPVAMYGV